MAQSSLEYWRQRETAQRDKNITEEAEYEKHIQKIYADTLDRVNKEINGFFVKYATKEGITIAEAKRRVSKLDIKEYSEKAKRYVEEKNFSEKANEEMRLYNLTMKVNRLELLKANIGLELIDGFSQLENYEGKILNDRTLAEMERQAGILGETVLEPAKKAHAIVNASFHNAQFSDRIWMYQDMLKSELSILLTRGLIQGLNPRQLAVDIKKRFGVSLSNATRLMRTEMARVQIGAQKQSYERNGYEEYEFIALTGHACEDCQALDGKHFKVIKMQPGLNAPPMHPNCRCSTAARGDREAMERELFGVQEESGNKTLLNKYGQEIIFDEKFLKKHSPEQIKLLKELAQEYDTRLLEVTGGAKNSAGEVTISGANMRLSSNGMSDALHEFAHTLANTDADKFGLTNDQAFWKEIKKIQKQYLKDVGGDSMRWISSYEHSSKSIDEFMAEAFAHAKMQQLGISIPSKYGSDFTYSKKVLDVVNKYFENTDRVGAGYNSFPRGAKYRAAGETDLGFEDWNRSNKTARGNVSTNALNNGRMKPDKIIPGHNSTPKKADPNSIIDHLGIDGKTETRTFYNGNGEKEKDITNHNHGNPKQHPYGKHGEHAHDYEWNEDGSLKTRTTRDITDQERKENRDIL